MADELIVRVDCCVPDWKINSTWTVEAATNSLIQPTRLIGV